MSGACCWIASPGAVRRGMGRSKPMTILLHELQNFVEACDPAVPLGPNDPRYVPLDEGTPVRGSNGRSCIDDLARTILFAGPGVLTCQVFTGFPGTGKTTELGRLGARLQASKDLPTRVIHVDFQDYINMYAPASVTDVLRVLAYVLDRDATVAEGKDPDTTPGYLRRLADFLTRTDVELKEIELKVGPEAFASSLKLEAKHNPTFRASIHKALAGRFQQFAADARSEMGQALARIEAATHTKRFVVICDGLEKIAPVREEEREQVEKSVEALYVQHAELLHLPCHAIYTFPVWLRFRTAPLGTLYSREPMILPSVKVAEPDAARTPYRAGYDKLIEILRRRLDVSRIFGANLAATLDPIVAASGGYTRDLLRLVREVLYEANTFPVGPKDCEAIARRLAEDYARTIRTPDLDLLVEVAKTHGLVEGDSARVARFGRLFEQFLILAYRNGSESYDLHPLVRRAPMVKARLGP
jgi:hypothetical protein